MALKFFEPVEDSGNGQLEFLNDWLEANPKNKTKQFLITEIRRTKSDKGYLISTTHFNVFIWKKQKLTTMLIEALDAYVNTFEHGYALYVVLKTPTSKDFSLAMDEDEMVTWFASKNGYTTTEPNASSKEESQGTNPFLPITPPTPLQAHTVSALNGR